MKKASIFAIVLLLMSVAVLACGSSTAVPRVDADLSAEPSEEPTVGPATAIPVYSPSPTTTPLQLEVVQSQALTDRDGDVRVNVLVRNPYDFPVAPAFRAQAKLLDSAGKLMRFQELYFLDGISGGNGFLLPGETIAANACFTCEKTPLTGAWDSLEFELSWVWVERSRARSLNSIRPGWISAVSLAKEVHLY